MQLAAAERTLQHGVAADKLRKRLLYEGRQGDAGGGTRKAQRGARLMSVDVTWQPAHSLRALAGPGRAVHQAVSAVCARTSTKAGCPAQPPCKPRYAPVVEPDVVPGLGAAVKQAQPPGAAAI